MRVLQSFFSNSINLPFTINYVHLYPIYGAYTHLHSYATISKATVWKMLKYTFYCMKFYFMWFNGFHKDSNSFLCSNLRQINTLVNSYINYISQPQHVIELITHLDGYVRQKYYLRIKITSVFYLKIFWKYVHLQHTR